MVTVMVVEDEFKLRDVIRRYLERQGLSVVTAASGAEALDIFSRQSPLDLVVLDLGLPDISGEEVAREMRSRSDVPIVMLTAKTEARDRIAGFELGADDYLTKPFSPRELVLRVQAVLRRGRLAGAPAGPVSYGGGELVIDEERRQVEVRGHQVEVTPTEWGILVALARVPGRVYSRYELISQVRGSEFEACERTVDSHVKNLRRKVETDPGAPRTIQTVLGGGYRLGLRSDG